MELRMFPAVCAVVALGGMASAQEGEPQTKRLRVSQPRIVVTEHGESPVKVRALAPQVHELVLDGERDGDRDQLRRDILRDVEKRLDRQMGELRTEIRKMLGDHMASRGEGRPNVRAEARVAKAAQPKAPHDGPQVFRSGKGPGEGHVYTLESRGENRDGHASGRMRIERDGQVLEERDFRPGEDGEFEFALPGGGRVQMRMNREGGAHARAFAMPGGAHAEAFGGCDCEGCPLSKRNLHGPGRGVPNAKAGRAPMAWFSHEEPMGGAPGQARAFRFHGPEGGKFEAPAGPGGTRRMYRLQRWGEGDDGEEQDVVIELEGDGEGHEGLARLGDLRGAGEELRRLLQKHGGLDESALRDVREALGGLLARANRAQGARRGAEAREGDEREEREERPAPKHQRKADRGHDF